MSNYQLSAISSQPSNTAVHFSELKDVGGADASQRIAGIDHQRRLAHDRVVVETPMIRRDERAVEAARQRLVWRHRLELDASLRQLRYVRIAVRNDRAALVQDLRNVDGRRFSDVPNVRLVGYTEICTRDPRSGLLTLFNASPTRSTTYFGIAAFI